MRSYLVVGVDVGELVLELRLLEMGSFAAASAQEVVRCIYKCGRVIAGSELGGVVTEKSLFAGEEVICRCRDILDISLSWNNLELANGDAMQGQRQLPCLTTGVEVVQRREAVRHDELCVMLQEFVLVLKVSENEKGCERCAK